MDTSARTCRACEDPAADTEKRGLAWMVGAFLICPCHLPLTLALIGALLAGTALGTSLERHPTATGIAITAAWLAATWRGIHLLRRPKAPRQSGVPS